MIVRKKVYQNKCVNGILKNWKNLVAEPVGPMKIGYFFIGPTG